MWSCSQGQKRILGTYGTVEGSPMSDHKQKAQIVPVATGYTASVPRDSSIEEMEKLHIIRSMRYGSKEDIREDDPYYIITYKG